MFLPQRQRGPGLACGIKSARLTYRDVKGALAARANTARPDSCHGIARASLRLRLQTSCSETKPTASQLHWSTLQPLPLLTPVAAHARGGALDALSRLLHTTMFFKNHYNDCDLTEF